MLGGLAPSELLFEQIIYSETLCTFWIVLSLFAYALTLANERTRIWDHALLGFSAALAGMTRPMFLFLGPLYFCLVFARVRPPRPPRLSDARLALVLAPTLLLALGWSAVNQYTVGYFGVTTTTGYNLSNHSGAFMELAPPAYRRISDIYVRQRLIQRWRMGNHTMTIWYAENEIKHSTGFSTAQLSMVLTQMSLEMFAEHPLLYLRSVSQSWARFWGSGLYRYLGSFKKHLTESFYDLLFAAASYQLAINLAFLSIAAYSIASWLLGRVKFDFELDVIAIVLAGSLLQAFMEYGENVRYLAPLVPLTIYTVVTFTWRASDLRGLLAA